MTTGWHRIADVDEVSKTGTCSVCGPVPLRRRVRRGKVEWSCRPRHSQYWKPAHRRHMAPMCEVCGFVPRHPAQLDAHHINEDHGDNRPANIGTLCANCHRLLHVDRAAFDALIAATNPLWPYFPGLGSTEGAAA